MSSNWGKRQVFGMALKVTGEQALAFGAFAAGVRFVTGYPGTPSKGVFASLQHLKVRHDAPIAFHWAVNEKVALELAVGATLAGLPSLVCVKSVGMNVLLDALMTANLAGVPAPLVIALGDDPSAWTSQNEQDTRWLALMSELPLMEPTQVRTAPQIMREAFALSAEFALPVIVRFPKAFAVAEESLDFDPLTLTPISVPKRDALPSIASGGNALRLHAELHEKLRQVEQRWNAFPFNRADGNAPIAVLAVGFCATKVAQVLSQVANAKPQLRCLFLATSHPLPRRWLAERLQGVASVLVVEEGEPVVETQLKALAHEFRLSCAVRGKLTGELPREGELTLRQIGRALRSFVDTSAEAIEALPHAERPSGFTLRFCDGCPFPSFLEVLQQVCAEQGWEPVVAADPGCAIVAMGKPYELVRIKHSMGGAVNFVAALAKLEGNPQRRYIALVGDSDFFHGALLGILNAAGWHAPISVLIVDNGGAAFTGGQPHLGSGFDAEGNFVAPVAMERLLEAAGIPVQVVSPFDAQALPNAVRWTLEVGNGLRVLILREPCPFVPVWTAEGLKPKKTEGKIVGE